MKTTVNVLQLNLSLHKSHILVKHGNWSMNGKKVFVSLEFWFFLLKLLLKFTPKYFFIPSHSVISPYNYFTISQLFNQKPPFEFPKKKLLEFLEATVPKCFD